MVPEALEPEPDAPFRLSPRLAFLLELGRCLQKYGAPAHRLEEALTRVAQRLGMEGQFFCGPTAFFAFIGEKGHRQRTYLERTETGSANLDKLSSVYEVARDVARGRMEAEAAHARLRETEAAPPRFSTLQVLLVSALASGLAATFFGGGWLDLLLAALAGLLGNLVPSLSPRFQAFAPALGALVVSCLAMALGTLPAAFSPTVVILAGLVIYLPGLTLVTSMNELATGHLVSGTARLSGVGMVFLQLAFGVLVGQQFGARWFPVHVQPAAALPGWTLWLAVVLSAGCYLVLFQGRPRDLGWTLGACLLSFGGARLGAAWIGPEFGVGLGSFLLGVGSNLFSRRYDRPSLTTLLPGLLLLVPGSWGFRSIGMLFQDQVVMGLDTAMRMIMLAMALLAGLVMANAAVRPRMVL